jgi:hypothetical protein
LDTQQQQLNNDKLAALIGDAINLSDKQITEMSLLKTPLNFKNKHRNRNNYLSTVNDTNTYEENLSVLLSQQEFLTKKLALRDEARLKQTVLKNIQLDNILIEQELKQLHT